MTNAQLLEYVFSQIGTERDTGMIKPMILAVANLAYRDLAQFLLDNDSELAKKLIASAANQTWANSSFSAPTDMLFHKQKETTRIDFGGILAFQIEDRDALDMVSSLNNHYYALEGKTFYIKHSAGTTSGTNLNIRYYKIPVVTDIDDDLRNVFLELLITRLVPKKSQPPNNK